MFVGCLLGSGRIGFRKSFPERPEFHSILKNVKGLEVVKSAKLHVFGATIIRWKDHIYNQSIHLVPVL